MQLDVEQINDLKEKGLVRTNTYKDLTVCMYQQKAQWENLWDEYPLLKQLRGCVIKEDGTIVAHCMSKFFNLNEKEETKTANLPMDISYKIYQKMDGSMISSYWYDNEFIHSTKASFNTIYSKKAKEFFPGLISEFHRGLTFVSEIRLPDNEEEMARVTKAEPGLYLITVFDNQGFELSRTDVEGLAFIYGLKIVGCYDSERLEDLLQFHHSVKDTEGYVVKFSNGLRVKLKTAWYLYLNRILEEIETPEKTKIFVKKALRDNDLSLDWIANLPDEFYDQINTTAQDILFQYTALSTMANMMFTGYKEQGLTKKDFAIKESEKWGDTKHLFFRLYDNKPHEDLLWDLIC